MRGFRPICCNKKELLAIFGHDAQSAFCAQRIQNFVARSTFMLLDRVGATRIQTWGGWGLVPRSPNRICPRPYHSSANHRPRPRSRATRDTHRPPSRCRTDLRIDKRCRWYADRVPVDRSWQLSDLVPVKWPSCPKSTADQDRECTTAHCTERQLPTLCCRSG